MVGYNEFKKYSPNLNWQSLWLNYSKIAYIEWIFIICIEIKISFQNSNSINFKQVFIIIIGLILINGIKIAKWSILEWRVHSLYNVSLHQMHGTFYYDVNTRQMHYPSLVAAGASCTFLELSWNFSIKRIILKPHPYKSRTNNVWAFLYFDMSHLK